MEKIKGLIQNPTIRLVSKISWEILMCLFVLFMLLLYKLRIFKPNKSVGFYCEDDTIRYPFYPDSDDLVSVNMLLVVTLGVGTLIIIIVEIFQQFKKDYSSPGKFPVWVHDLIYAVMIYLFSFTISYAIPGSHIKIRVGRLRPYFIADCRPNINCLDPANMFKYHTKFRCLNHKINPEEWKSYPSGHTMGSFGPMTFLAVYLQYRMTSEVTLLPRCMLQFFSMMFAVYTGCSRYIAHKHHSTDIATGAVIGITIGLTFALWLPHFFKKVEKRNKSGDALVVEPTK